MKLTNRRIKVNIGKTINTGNFNSARVDIGMEADIGEKDDVDEVVTAITEYLSEQLPDVIKNGGIMPANDDEDYDEDFFKES